MRFELRGWLEVSAIARAAQVRTASDLEKVAAALAAMDAERSSVQGWLALDDAFHRAIVEATGNVFALTILAAISELMNAARDRAYQDAGETPSWLAESELEGLMRVHRRIAAAIRRGDEAAARRGGIEHPRLLERNVAELDPWGEASRPRRLT